MDLSDTVVFAAQIVLLSGLVGLSAAYGCLWWERRRDPVFHLCVAVINVLWLVISRADIRYMPDWLMAIFDTDIASGLWIASAIWGVCHLGWCLYLNWQSEEQ